MSTRKKRSDRNHIVYKITCDTTRDSYIGVTVAIGQAYLRSVKVRFQRHWSAAICNDKDWKIASFIREHIDASYRYEVVEVVRGRKSAHKRERELIGLLSPTLNTK
jgi:hypothetical protein